MSSSCTTYKKILVLFDSGIGHPFNRMFTVFNKKMKELSSKRVTGDGNESLTDDQ